MARRRTRRSPSRRSPRRKRTTRRSPTVSFTTRRGKRVSFRTRPYGSRGRRRRSAWNNVFAKASRACRRKRGVRPFTKKFGKCMKAELRGGKRSGGKRRSPPRRRRTNRRRRADGRFY